MIKLSPAIHPEAIRIDIDGDDQIMLENLCDHGFTDLKLTVSFYDQQENYLDFQDFEIEDLSSRSSQTVELDIKAPDGALTGTLDLEGTRQTFLKRHWGKLSTVVILIWGLIVLSRRFAPDL